MYNNILTSPENFRAYRCKLSEIHNVTLSCIHLYAAQVGPPRHGCSVSFCLYIVCLTSV